MAHTKGEWKQDHGRIMVNKTMIAKCNTFDNARLIASAPVLLEACKNISELIDDAVKEIGGSAKLIKQHYAYEGLQQAIKQAEGGN